MILETERLLM